MKHIQKTLLTFIVLVFSASVLFTMDSDDENTALLADALSQHSVNYESFSGPLTQVSGNLDAINFTTKQNDVRVTHCVLAVEGLQKGVLRIHNPCGQSFVIKTEELSSALQKHSGRTIAGPSSVTTCCVGSACCGGISIGAGSIEMLFYGITKLVLHFVPYKPKDEAVLKTAEFIYLITAGLFFFVGFCLVGSGFIHGGCNRLRYSPGQVNFFDKNNQDITVAPDSSYADLNLDFIDPDKWELFLQDYNAGNIPLHIQYNN